MNLSRPARLLSDPANGSFLRVDLVLWLLELPRLLDGSLPLPLDLELLVLATQRCVSMLLARAEETTDTTKWSSCAGTSLRCRWC
jgi:hypothetical protein